MEAVIDDYIEPAELTVSEGETFLVQKSFVFVVGLEVVSATALVLYDFLQLHSARYQEEVTTGKVSYNTAFDYGWCLIRSRKTDEVMKGIEMFKRTSVIF